MPKSHAPTANPEQGSRSLAVSSSSFMDLLRTVGSLLAKAVTKLLKSYQYCDFNVHAALYVGGKLGFFTALR